MDQKKIIRNLIHGETNRKNDHPGSGSDFSPSSSSVSEKSFSRSPKEASDGHTVDAISIRSAQVLS